MQHVFIIGSRGLPAKYGGFETFVDQLVSNQVSSQIKYHVACLSDQKAYEHFEYKGVDCFTIKAPKLGPARVIAYDMMAINYALKIIREENIEEPIFYVLGNTIGAFVAPFATKIHKIGGKFYINPDGPLITGCGTICTTPMSAEPGTALPSRRGIPRSGALPLLKREGLQM